MKIETYDHTGTLRTRLEVDVNALGVTIKVTHGPKSVFPDACIGVMLDCAEARRFKEELDTVFDSIQFMF